MAGLIGSVLLITPVAVAVAQPQAAACATIGYRGLEGFLERIRLGDGFVEAYEE